MKNLYTYIILVLVALAPFRAAAADEPHDTVYFYDTWADILYQDPVAALIDPYIWASTPFQIGIEIEDEALNKAIKQSHIAATMGDSTWLINSEYLKREFHGDTKKLSDYMPFFFNEKVAYVAYVGEGDNMSLGAILFGDWVDYDYEDLADYYYIDFANRKVIKITHNTLSALLEDYHDLQMRYEGMKDYKKREIIREFFIKYVERATMDPLRPYILDLEEDNSAEIN